MNLLPSGFRGSYFGLFFGEKNSKNRRPNLTNEEVMKIMTTNEKIRVLTQNNEEYDVPEEEAVMLWKNPGLLKIGRSDILQLGFTHDVSKSA